MEIGNSGGDNIYKLLKPETALELEIMENPSFSMGLFWGEPRYGHPEGKVLYHIREVLNNVEIVTKSFPKYRTSLRLIALSHDTFKYKEDKQDPRDWTRHHGILAREFMDKYVSDHPILDIIELHDEAYYCWRLAVLQKQIEDSENRMRYLLSRVKDDLQLYYLFFKCDTRTGDKTQAPVKWFEKNVSGIEILGAF